jgi:hypothetical protein
VSKEIHEILSLALTVWCACSCTQLECSVGWDGNVGIIMEYLVFVIIIFNRLSNCVTIIGLWLKVGVELLNC